MNGVYLNAIYVGGGLCGLFLGGEALIRGAVAVAERLRIPKLLIGLVLVGFGTSLPELLVSLRAVQDQAPDVAVGNVVGSNIANLLLIAGVGALIRPMATGTAGLKRDAVVMVGATIALTYCAWRGNLTTQMGLMMVAAVCLYLLVAVISGWRAARAVVTANASNKPLSLPLALVGIGGGIVLLVGGAGFLVEGATAIASALGVSQALIGLTLVAVGTSLPELTVGVMGAIKGQNEVSLGNVLGSNIFNILVVLGAPACAYPIAISPRFFATDLPVLLTLSGGLALLIFTQPKIGRWTGAVSLSLYGAYMAWLTLGPERLTALFHEMVQAITAAVAGYFG